ncbi:SDR family oxidoreductase [Brevibacterium sp. BRM-1]|uniref:SDR family oxidoreductase n=1 Tax=Brevibacterium sp. BRM-1 TaxID=2999062 RepID=UPI002280D79E|nr:SDR family oxidoreductase [Brevibacterium sp. BRM-1]WAL39484.1 SDR family oxidoreductase [Brevibacterium sp. BRM-1]
MAMHGSTTDREPLIAVTGATGALGGRVSRLLNMAGWPQRLLVRDRSRAPRLPHSTVYEAPFGGGAEVQRALRGVSVLFMVSATEAEDRQRAQEDFVAAAAAAGVQHIVYTSFAGADESATFEFARTHAAAEAHIRDAGMAYTFLRDNFYQEVFPLWVGEDGALRGPAGDGRVAAVARNDVARTAARVLADIGSHLGSGSGQEAPHAGRAYDMTGPRALTLGEIARILSEAQGREVRYVDETLEEAYASRAASGAPQWQLDAWVSTYTAIAKGELEHVSDDIKQLTGTPAASLERTLREAL